MKLTKVNAKTSVIIQPALVESSYTPNGTLTIRIYTSDVFDASSHTYLIECDDIPNNWDVVDQLLEIADSREAIRVTGTSVARSFRKGSRMHTHTLFTVESWERVNHG